MLPDLLGPGLQVVFVGTSVSTTSADRGHYYSNPGNKFWELLRATGLVGDDPLGPDDDVRLPELGVGLTDVVKGRAESSDARLGSSDFDVPAFTAKVETYWPGVVAFNGDKACKAGTRQLREAAPAIGPASWTLAGARVYRLPSSSGTAALGPEVKRRAWADFGDWVRAAA